MKKFLYFLLGRANTSWNRVPEHSTSEAVLILTKALLLDAQELTDSAEGYTEESTFSQGQRYYVDIITRTLGRILDKCKALTDTPLGDHRMLDALALARAQLEEAGQMNQNCKR